MADQKHTAGPWKIERFSNDRKEWLEIWPDPQDRLGAGHIIASITLQIAGLDRDLDEANARLIAAAPELQARIDRLEAEKAELVEAYGIVESMLTAYQRKNLLKYEDNKQYKAIKAARAAIAKAETTPNPKPEEPQ